MKAWAILLGSNKYNAIFCVIANTEQEALGKALSQLSNNLSKKNDAKEEVKDYRAIIWTPCEILPSGKIVNGIQETSSFDDQIRQILPQLDKLIIPRYTNCVRL